MNIAIVRGAFAVLLLCLTASCTSSQTGGPRSSGDIARLSATELEARLQTGDLTAAAVTDAFLARIAAVDDAGPTLNAILEINPEVRDIAAGLDERFAAAGPVGPLHGLPVVLKANIDTGDRMATDAGSLALADHHAPDDAFLVARLRAAGAVILGKANLSEWANFRGRHATSGWSSVGGQTRNPYVLDRNPCGSSSGPAVAVAARLAPLAVGTETDGSIICPSSINGVVGIKPTVGTVSRHGIIPISATQDTAGPMGRTVMDAALLLSVMVGYDPEDPAPKRFPADHPALLPEAAPRPLEGLRIGVNRSYYGVGAYPAIGAIYERAVSELQALGATIVDPIELELPDSMFDAEQQAMLYEFKAGLNDYLASHPVPEDRNTLAKLIAWNRDHADRVMPIFGQELFEEAEAKGDLTDEAYAKALQDGADRMRGQLAKVLTDNHLDALLTVAGSFAWKTDWVAGDRFMVGSSSLAAMSGFPNITVPAGAVSGLPIGIAFVAEPLAEPRLTRIAYAFEQATRARREPTFRPTLETAAEPAESASGTAAAHASGESRSSRSSG